MDIDNSALVYQVFRYTFMDDKSYSVQMELKHGIEDEKAEQIMLKASEEGFLTVVKDSQPQEYRVNFDALIEKFYEYWEEELEEFNTPVAISDFLEGYMKSYLKNEENASIKKMLQDDLFKGLSNMESERGLPKGVDEMHREMSRHYEGPNELRDYVQKGLDNS